MRFDHVLNVHHSINLLLALLEHLAFPLEVISDLGQDLGEGLRCEQRLESFKNNFKLWHLKILVLS